MRHFNRQSFLKWIHKLKEARFESPNRPLLAIGEIDELQFPYQNEKMREDIFLPHYLRKYIHLYPITKGANRIIAIPYY